MTKQAMSDGQLAQIVRENSFLLSPVTQNNWFERCLSFESKRMNSAEWLHDQIFKNSFLQNVKASELLGLYSAMLNDVQKQKISNLKIVEMKENSRIVSGIAKAYAEQEARRQIAQSEQSHTDAFIQALLDQSLRHAMIDQQDKQIGGSNSYRPPEDTNFDIIVKDANADE